MTRVRTRVLASKRATCEGSLHAVAGYPQVTAVGPVGLEPTTRGLKDRSYPPHPPPPDSTGHTDDPTNGLHHHRSPQVRATNRATRRRGLTCAGSFAGEGARSGPRRTPTPT
jgi:hypothetical protein